MTIVGRMDFHGKSLDIYDDIDNPLFLAVDVAKMIDYSVGNTSHMLETLNSDEKVYANMNTRNNRTSIRGNPNMWFLTEDGLYEVLFQSRKPIAKQFKFAVKKILRELRHSKQFNISDWFNYLEILNDEEGLEALREDILGYRG